MILDGKYSFIKELGKGSFGVVILAEELISKRKVAIKKLNTRSEKVQDLIKHEIKVISKFQHPNVVQYYHYFYENNSIHLVMEYCEGGCLRERIQKQNITNKRAIEWTIVLCKVIRFLHVSDVFHKDIKPDNILFSKDGILKISDFGISNTRMGTKSYMAPEALQGDHTFPRAIDIYAVGVTLLEMLYGVNPFKFLSCNEIIQIHRNKKYYFKNIPKWQEKIILKAIDPNPKKRFQYIIELEEAIHA